MQTKNPPLPPGYSPLPPGCIANVVTCLQMFAPPPARGVPAVDASVLHWENPDFDQYMTMYRLVGSDWLWTSRFFQTDDVVRDALANPQIEVLCLMQQGSRVGWAELDFRVAGECELVYFGVASEVVGSGLGRLLMSHAIARAWAAPIRRFWLHTCTFDHPAAVGFYRRSGFVPYATMVEVVPDPRLTGHLPKTAAPHVPVIDATG
jgi:GNAT superfamily N-acetyltransferase